MPTSRITTLGRCLRRAAPRLAALSLALSGLAAPALAANDDHSKLAQELRASLVQLRITSQDWHPRLPWRLGTVSQLSGVGVVVGSGQILTNAHVLQDARLIEVFLPTTRSTAQARVDTLDLADNLALLSLQAIPGTVPLPTLTPVALGAPPVKGDSLLAAQLERGTQVELEPLSAADYSMAFYPLFGVQQLSLNIDSSSKRAAAAGFMPVFNPDKKLVALFIQGKKSGVQQLIPTEVIERFLARAAPASASVQQLQSVALPGVRHAPLQDPFLRLFVGLPADKQGQGVYIAAVSPWGAAHALGIKSGDVLLSLSGNALQDDGYYRDARYGPMYFGYLFSRLQVGQTLSGQVWRAGKVVDVEGQMPALPTLHSRLPLIDPPHGPRYLVFGGMVFLEATLPWLQSFGDNWEEQAPLRVLHALNLQLRQEQHSGQRSDQRIVLLSSVLPLPSVQGYQDLGPQRVLRINGTAITRLEDVAQALQQPIPAPAAPLERVHRIDVDDLPQTIYVHDAAAQQDNRSLQQAPWLIPQLRRF